MLPIPFGVDPDETWEIDLVQSIAKRGVILGRAVAKRLAEDAAREPDAKKREALEAAVKSSEATAARLETDLASYDGAGPVFLVAPLPNGKRGEVLGEGYGVTQIEDPKERGARDDAWAVEVVRWTVRGHRNLKRRNGEEIPFASESVKWAGKDRPVVAPATLEAYGPFLRDLADAIVASQRFDEAGKNA